MHWKGANRLYSRRSLKVWSRFLEKEWEGRFSHEAIARGRTLYRKGNIREVSLSESDAIMTCKEGKEESYSVVEWENTDFTIRSSSADSLYGDAIAVAGFLEIEELLADEDLSLLSDDVLEMEDESQSAGPQPQGGGGYLDDVRMLHLVLDTHYRGLVCQAYWLSDRDERTPALRDGDGSPRARNSVERERLITLAALARKSHFEYCADFNGYLLENLAEIPFFIHKVWPSWKKSFSTEEHENISRVQESVTALDVRARATLGEGGKLDLQWIFDSGRGLLSPEDQELLLKNNGSPILAPEHGIIRLSSASRQLIADWDHTGKSSGENSERQLYQLFSLFPSENEKQTLELDEKLRSWRDRLLNPQERNGKTFLAGLRPYQENGVNWMSRMLEGGCHCLLADEMGLGKTVQVIALTKEELESGRKALVVCPSSVVPVWISEFGKFAPKIRVQRYVNQPLEEDILDWDVLVISFALLRNRIEKLEKRLFDYAIIDEAQFIKNPDTKATRSCLRINAEKRIALTGTPIENRPLDIWPSFQFLMPGLLGPRYQFETRLKENPNAFKSRLRDQIQPFVLRRTKDQVADDLPEKIIIDQVCSISKLQATEYASICAAGAKKIGSDLGAALQSHRFATLSLLTRLRQASCDPDLLPWVDAALEDSGKLMVLLEKLIEVLGTGHKVVIFSQFVRFLNRVRELMEASFPDLPLYELTGATRDRETPVRQFQDSTDTAAILVSLRAAGTGITLHAADYVFLLDPWWNPAVENQAIDRVHRIGQKNTVFVYRLIAKGTIEERIHQLQRDKSELFESIVQNTASGADQIARHFKSLEALLVLSQSD